MKIFIHKLGIIALGFLAISSSMVRANVVTEVKLIAPEKFYDAKVTGFNRHTGYKMINAQLNELVNEVSSKLLNDQSSLLIEVTDLDLAGYIEYFFGPQRQDMRIVTDNERYRLEFKYQLKNSDGKVISEGEHKIKKFLTHMPKIKKYNKYQLVDYMHDDIAEWAAATFAK